MERLKLLLVSLCFIGQAVSQCNSPEWGGASCRNYPFTQEIYKQTSKSGKVMYGCCYANSKPAKIYESRGKNCLPSPCEPKATSGDDICPTRTVRGRRVQVEEVLRDECTLPSGEEGVIAQCCVNNSPGGLLLTTLGAEMNEFPHQAALSMGCGGTIYNERYILTAAHCVTDANGDPSKPESVKVTLGTNIGGHSDFESKDHVYTVENITRHWNYSDTRGNDEREKPLNLRRTFNDVALLRLDKNIEFGEHVKSLELAPSDFQPLDYADRLVIVGWGTTDTGDVSQHLQKANMLIRSDSRCFASGRPYSYHGGGLDDQLLCIGGIMDGVFAPVAGGGDSGGPAICRNEDGYAVLCGVTSYGSNDGTDCGKHQDAAHCAPSIYAEVEHFRDWIEEHAGEQNNETFFRAKLYGEPVSEGEYEHQVHITSSNGKSCGGTLISNDTVITAAQCVVRNDGTGKLFDKLRVTTNLRDLDDKAGQTFKLKNYATLPGFKRVGPPVGPGNLRRLWTKGYRRDVMVDNYHTNDMAILKLNGVVDIDEGKLPQLPSETPTGLATEISFPRNTSRGGGLIQRTFKFVDHHSCQTRMNRLKAAGIRDVTVDSNVLCAVETYSGGSVCDRELGGGLICMDGEGRDVLCGVQIFRMCEMTIPNGFIDVSQYNEVIRNTTQKM